MNDKKLETILYKVLKPSRYTGGELNSFNKDFEKTEIRAVLAFPDKYEIGISNYGQRLLYYLINKQENMLSDRVYAPEQDFKEESEKNNIPLCGLESKKSLKEFDFIGFSLQYELSFPTVLKMLEMSDIPIKNTQRGENDPIVTAGGPCVFNPSVMKDFIDVFLIGDGEDLILEILKVKGTRKEKLEKIAELEGAYVPSIHKGEVIKKRVCELTYENHPKSFPVSFSQSVHDRAVVELRRGCSRLCRFCQAAYTNFPVRERKSEDVIKLAKENVASSGCEEYSLLSLSSNDYTKIEEVVEELNKYFKDKRVSVSLPSQRADKFNIKLAKLIQEVRKSAITLAPEAGSQRLRDVINKNLSEEEILKATLACYEEGWSKIKYYFMIGLPTETYEDLDEIIELLSKVRRKSFELKKEKGFNHYLDITCSVSVFVPKPHTPFQYVGQNSVEEIYKKMYYLKDKAKSLKGVKINVHAPYTSQIEAVLARGDEKVGKLIEKLYEKGVYLASWEENFDYELWKNTAKEIRLDIDKLSQKTFTTEEKLPWDNIDVGMGETFGTGRQYLVGEYQKAISKAIEQ